MFFRSRITTGILAVVVAGLVFLAASATLRSRAARSELRALSDRIEQEQRGNDRLSRALERMRKPNWLALLARARLNYKAVGETVIFVYKSEKSDILSQPQQPTDERPNWRKWWDWLITRD
jgi:cell division protein FtsB